METLELDLPGLLLLRPKIFHDSRGWFLEPYNEARYREAGVLDRFVQDNHSRSSRGTVRGLHYQGKPGQAKLVRVGVGRIFDVAVDIRADSATFGKWLGVELDAERHEQLYIPIGFAHGFCVLSDVADVLYKVSTHYDPAEERTISWDDSDIAIRWPVEVPVLSARDRGGEPLADYRKKIYP